MSTADQRRPQRGEQRGTAVQRGGAPPVGVRGSGGPGTTFRGSAGGAPGSLMPPNFCVFIPLRKSSLMAPPALPPTAPGSGIASPSSVVSVKSGATSPTIRCEGQQASPQRRPGLTVRVDGPGDCP